MTNVRTMRAADITPQILIQHVADAIPDLKEMYVVGLTHDGEPVIWTTGDLRGLSMATVVLHDLALKHLNGCLVQEGSEGDDVG